MTLKKILKKKFKKFDLAIAEPPKYGRRFLLLSGSASLQLSLFSTISALSSAKGAVSIPTVHLISAPDSQEGNKCTII